MTKRGPTPDPTAGNAQLRRRVEGPSLRPEAIGFPPAESHWLPDTRQAYGDYTASEVARMVHEESLPQVRLLFEYWDRIERLLDVDVISDAEPLKTAQAIKVYDGMAARLAAELGVGPLARVRLGLKTAEAGSKLSDLLGGRPK